MLQLHACLMKLLEDHNQYRKGYIGYIDIAPLHEFSAPQKSSLSESST